MKTSPIKFKKIKSKVLRGKPRAKGAGRTKTTGLTKGYGLNTGKQNISLAPTKMVRMKKNLLKTKTAAYGTKPKRKKKK
tara:strand:- start:907 stop:1143 length:237 start_codon:yes stop_codon:yes gene_type:complete